MVGHLRHLWALVGTYGAPLGDLCGTLGDLSGTFEGHVRHFEGPMDGTPLKDI